MSRRSWKQGSRYKLPACSFKRKKYKFTGWKNTRTGKVYKAGTKVTAGMKLASSVDNYPIYFKAQWKRK